MFTLTGRPGGKLERTVFAGFLLSALFLSFKQNIAQLFLLSSVALLWSACLYRNFRAKVLRSGGFPSDRIGREHDAETVSQHDDPASGLPDAAAEGAVSGPAGDRAARGLRITWAALGLLASAMISSALSGGGALGIRPALGQWRFALALAIVLDCLPAESSRMMKKLVFHVLLASYTVSTLLVYALAPRFWSLRKTNFLGVFSAGSPNVFSVVWASIAIVAGSSLLFRVGGTLPVKVAEEGAGGRSPDDIPPGGSAGPGGRTVAARTGDGLGFVPAGLQVPLLLFALFAVGASRSRAAAGMLVAALVCSALLRASKKVLAVTFLAVLVLFMAVPRLRTIPSGRNNSYFFRYETCRLAWNMFRERPVFGIGTGRYRAEFRRMYGGPLLGFYPRCAADFYFTTLAEQGLVGLLIFLVYIFAVAGELYRRARDDMLSMGVFIAFVAYLAAGLVLDNRFLGHQSGMAFVLLAAMTSARRPAGSFARG